MKDRVLNLYNDLITRWKGIDQGQQRRLILAAAGVVLAIGLTVFIAVRPQWVTLTGTNNLGWSELQQVSETLEATGINNRVVRNVVQVRRQDYEIASMRVHSQTEVFAGRASTFSLTSALEHIGMGTSEAEMNEMFRRVQENDLEAQIMTIQGIQDVTVTITPGEPRTMFIANMPRPSASVIVTTDRMFAPADAMNLATMVMNSVEGLTLDNISISDQNLRTIFNGAQEGEARFGSMLGGEVDHRQLARANAEMQVLEIFGPMFDAVSAAASIEVDMDTVEITQVNYSGNEDGQGFVSAAEVLREESQGTPAPQPEVGVGPNAGVPGFPGAQAMETSASRELEHHNFMWNTQTEHRVTAQGNPNFENSNISVTVSRNQVFDQSIMEQNGLFEEGMNWALFTMQNQAPVSMELPAAEMETLIQMISNATSIPVENISLFAQYVPVLIPSVVAPVPWDTIVLLVILAALLLMLAYALIRRNKVEEEIIEVEPELSVEDLLVSSRIEEAEEELAASLQEIAFSMDSEVKQQIDKFVNEKPEAVAQLLRSWMNEGWE